MRARLEPIIPKRSIASPDEVEQAIELTLDELAAEAKALYEKTVATWNTKVNFTIRKTKFGRSVGTSNRIFKFVDQGTEAHPIPKSPLPYPLRFNVGGFRAKTRPKVLASYKGAPGRTPTVAWQVQHPGTEARLYTQIINTKIRLKWSATFKRNLRKAQGIG